MSRSDWACPQCEQWCPQNFRVCWNCGSSREGRAVADFRKEDELSEQDGCESLCTPTQTSVKDMFAVLIAATVMLAGAALYSPYVGVIFCFSVLVILPNAKRIAGAIRQHFSEDYER